jgi:hypothetical protein
MKKIFLPATALAMALALNALPNHAAPKKGTTSYYYLYWGLQDTPDRENLANYILSVTPTTDPICSGDNECAVEMSFPIGRQTSTLVGQNILFDANGFPVGGLPGGTGTFVTNKKKP